MCILIQWRNVFKVNFVTSKFGKMGIKKYKENPLIRKYYYDFSRVPII